MPTLMQSSSSDEVGVCWLQLGVFRVAHAGAKVLGELAYSGIGEAVPAAATAAVEKSIAELKRSRAHNNRTLTNELRKDEHAEALLKQAHDDAALGRMSVPCRLDTDHLDEWLLHPRFSAVQEKEDGRVKVHDCSWSKRLPVHCCRIARCGQSIIFPGVQEAMQMASRHPTAARQPVRLRASMDTLSLKRKLDKTLWTASRLRCACIRK